MLKMLEVLNVKEVKNLVEEVRSKFPPQLASPLPQISRRDLFHISLAYVPNGSYIDLGGGYSPVAPILSKLGMRATVVDTFASTAFYDTFDVEKMRKVLESYGVQLVTADLRSFNFDSMFSSGSVDSISSYDTLYFFHPRDLLEKAVVALRPGGKLTVSLNNGVSVLKRIKVLAGRSNVEPFEEYFFKSVQQRFWVKSDVERLAKYLGLREYRIMGRNWSAFQKWQWAPTAVLQLIDGGLRFFPGLCTSLYLVGKK